MSGSLPEPVAGLAGLRSFEPSGTPLGVVGWPVRHSLSPPMHRAALRALASADPSFADWNYGAFELRPEDLREAVELFREKGFRGVNLTVPHKVDVLPLIEEIDPLAERMGAVNTLHFAEGRRHGSNSDGYGLENAVEEAFGAGLAGRTVLLVGAGGAARAAAVQCVESGVEKLWIANRTAAKAESLARRAGSGSPVPVEALSSAEAPGAVPPGTLVINATSLGLGPDDPLPLPVTELPDRCQLFDMIYNPAETPFLAAGRMRGYPVSNGLGMLVHQGVRSLEIWTGCTPDALIMREACERALSDRRAIG